MSEILTVNELATMLKLSKSQVYELVNERTRSGEVRKNPIPAVRIGTSVRFIKADVEAWLAKLAS
jgi:predicted DNA-binding transcriptional regulator AlpA